MEMRKLMMYISKNTRGCTRCAMKEELLKILKDKLIVSCQAYEENPLYGKENMLVMAKCAYAGGANILRICWPEQVELIKKNLDVIVIGINKQFDESLDMYHQVFITPTYSSAVALIEAGCDIVAMDGTLRKRCGEDLATIVTKLKKEYPEVPLMADIATLEEGIACEKMGFDILSSTLSGYTDETKEKAVDPDYQLVEDLVQNTNCFINAEGRIWNTVQMKRMKKCKPDSITIGAAITNPMKITEYFLKALKEAS